jgi:hypothetical protein
MFLQESQGKVIFNMLYYKLHRNEKQIKIFDMQNNYLGVCAEYTDEKIADYVMQEMKALFRYCKPRKIFTVYEFPEENEIKELMSHENG